jgi:hypothetical protein
LADNSNLTFTLTFKAPKTDESMDNYLKLTKYKCIIKILLALLMLLSLMLYFGTEKLYFKFKSSYVFFLIKFKSVL